MRNPSCSLNSSRNTVEYATRFAETGNAIAVRNTPFSRRNDAFSASASASASPIISGTCITKMYDVLNIDCQNSSLLSRRA